MPAGMTPLNLVPYKYKYWSLTNCPIVAGRTPDSPEEVGGLFPFQNTCIRLAGKFSGMVPAFSRRGAGGLKQVSREIRPALDVM
jgi:hypothetical protein